MQNKNKTKSKSKIERIKEQNTRYLQDYYSQNLNFSKNSVSVHKLNRNQQ